MQILKAESKENHYCWQHKAFKRSSLNAFREDPCQSLSTVKTYHYLWVTVPGN